MAGEGIAREGPRDSVLPRVGALDEEAGLEKRRDASQCGQQSALEQPTLERVSRASRPLPKVLDRRERETGRQREQQGPTFSSIQTTFVVGFAPPSLSHHMILDSFHSTRFSNRSAE